MLTLSRSCSQYFWSLGASLAGPTGSLFEVTLGGWSNTKSVIKRIKNGPNIAVHHGSVLSETEYRAFILDWSKSKVLELYSIDETGSIVRIMSTPRQPETALNVTAIGVSTGWGAKGCWKLGSSDIPWRVGPIQFARDNKSNFLDFALPDVTEVTNRMHIHPWFISPPLEEMGYAFLATRQPELIDVELSCFWRDQGFGNRKGQIQVRLAGVKEWQLLSPLGVFAPHTEEQLVAKLPRQAFLGKPSFPLRLELGYIVGAGGGHKLYIRNANLKIRFSDRKPHLQFIEELMNSFRNLDKEFGQMNPKQFNQDEKYKEALCSAIEYKQKSVKLLLAPSLGHIKVDPVHALVAGGYHGVLEKILEMGFDPDVYDQLGFTPLMIASQWGLLDAASVLVHGGARLDLADQGHGMDDDESYTGSNALMMALMKENFDVAEMLLEPTIISGDIHRKDTVRIAASASRYCMDAYFLLFKYGCAESLPVRLEGLHCTLLV